MTTADYIFNAHSQFYAEYELSTILKRAKYSLSSIEIVKESFLVEGETQDFLVARVIAMDERTGAISYPTIYPRYFTDNLPIEALLGKCDDLYVRFSIFFNKTGFFSPLWTTLIKDGVNYEPTGPRMDWDKYKNVAPKMSYNVYSMLKKQAENSTALQNDEVVLRTLPIWLSNASIVKEGHWAY